MCSASLTTCANIFTRKALLRSTLTRYTLNLTAFMIHSTYLIPLVNRPSTMICFVRFPLHILIRQIKVTPFSSWSRKRPETILVVSYQTYPHNCWLRCYVPTSLRSYIWLLRAVNHKQTLPIPNLLTQSYPITTLTSLFPQWHSWANMHF